VQPQRLHSSAPPTATLTSMPVPGNFVAQTTRSGAMALPRLERQSEPVADLELCQIRSLHAGSLDNLTAVSFSRCVMSAART
jgi:hypothetical protein